MCPFARFHVGWTAFLCVVMFCFISGYGRPFHVTHFGTLEVSLAIWLACIATFSLAWEALFSADLISPVHLGFYVFILL